MKRMTPDIATGMGSATKGLEENLETNLLRSAKKRWLWSRTTHSPWKKPVQ